MILTSTGYGQERCGTMQHLEMQKAMNPQVEIQMENLDLEVQQWIKLHKGQNKFGAIITIPTVVHVVYNSASENISDAQVISQIEVLNEDFRKMNADTSNTPDAFKSVAADTEIEFCLALRDPNGNPTNGITRTSTTETSFSTNDDVKFNATGGKDAWPTLEYLNIWVCDLSGGILGYGEFPFGIGNTWGLVVDNTAFGRVGNVSPPYHLGRTTVHEICHCFNLYHIWGDDGGTCNGSDGISDTPDQAGSTFGCPSYPELDACSPDTPGVMFMNYMDYSYDACTNMFTYGQKDMMLAVLNSVASGLKTSLGCIPPNALDASMAIAAPNDTACGTNAFYPEVTLTNVGSDTLTSVSINYQLDAELPKIYAWSGSLATLASEQIILSPLVASVGSHTLTVYSENPNGGTDGYLLNDSSQSSFAFVIGNSTTLTLNLGDFQIAQLLSWDVRDSMGIVVDSSGGYEKNKSYSEVICLPNGCYTFSFYDPPANAIGSFILSDAEGSTIASGNSLTDTSFSFCVTLPPPIDTTSINQIDEKLEDVIIYPNPSSGSIYIKTDKYGGNVNNFSIEIYNVLGERVHVNAQKEVSGNVVEIDMSNEPRGMYLMRVNTGSEAITKRIVLTD